MRAPSEEPGTHADLVKINVSHVATDNKGLSLYIYRIRCKIKQREYQESLSTGACLKATPPKPPLQHFHPDAAMML